MDGDLTPRERKARLRSFAPADAAFVLHLMQCERCRRHAGKLLVPCTRTASVLPDLSPEELEILRHLVRVGYLLSEAGGEPTDDLPLAELQKFLQALSPEQSEFIGHLLDCEPCRQAVEKILNPLAVSAARKLPVMLG